MNERQITIEIEVSAPSGLRPSEIVDELFKAEMQMNAGNRLRFHLTNITLAEIKKLSEGEPKV